jgi:hypothetical protein
MELVSLGMAQRPEPLYRPAVHDLEEFSGHTPEKSS